MTDHLPETRAPSLVPGLWVGKVEYKFLENKGTGCFECYASAFGNEDDNGDLILSGAFTKTLAEYKGRGTMPKMLLNHGGLPYGMVATAESLVPVGGWDQMAEDSHGLAGEAHLLHLDTEGGKRLYNAMKDKQIDSMSITYIAKDFTRGQRPNEPRRTIKSVDLLEAGPVTFPANKLARVTAFKNGGPLPDIIFLERLLREAGGLSRSEAKALLAGGFKALPLREAEGDADLAAALDRATALLRAN
jgi:uncharacterized protein